MNVEWHGEEVFPDDDRDVQWDPSDADLDLLWREVRETVGEMARGEAEDFLHDLGLVIDAGTPRDALDVVEGAESPEEMAARAHGAAKRVAPRRVRD